MSTFFTRHAMDRALERYGLDLTRKEMWEIFIACRDGKALCGRVGEQGAVYMVRVRDQVVVPALNDDKTAIITFLPRDYFTSGASLRHYMSRGAKQRPRRQNARLDGYRRERITIQQALEAE